MMKWMTITLVYIWFVITLFWVLIQIKYNRYINWMKFMNYIMDHKRLFLSNIQINEKT